MFKIDIEELKKDEKFMNKLMNEILGQMEESVDGMLSKAIDSFINENIKEKIDLQIKNRIAEIVEEGLDKEFEEVDQWGESKGKFTTRDRLVKLFRKEATFKPRGGYSSEENAFTRSLKSMLEQNMKMFRKEFNKVIDSEYLKECQDYAVKKLKNRLKL